MADRKEGVRSLESIDDRDLDQQNTDGRGKWTLMQPSSLLHTYLHASSQNIPCSRSAIALTFFFCFSNRFLKPLFPTAPNLSSSSRTHPPPLYFSTQTNFHCQHCKVLKETKKNSHRKSVERNENL